MTAQTARRTSLKTCLLPLGPCKLAIASVANGSAAQVVVAALAVPITRRPVAVARCQALVVATDAVASFVPVYVATLEASPIIVLRGRHAGRTGACPLGRNVRRRCSGWCTRCKPFFCGPFPFQLSGRSFRRPQGPLETAGPAGDRRDRKARFFCSFSFSSPGKLPGPCDAWAAVAAAAWAAAAAPWAAPA
jgi:hypothetical protein